MVKDANRAMKVAYKTWLQNKADAFAVRWGAKVCSPHGKKGQNGFLDEFWENWIPVTGKPTLCSGKPSGVSAEKKSNLVDSSRPQWLLTQQWGEHPWQMERVFQRSFELSHSGYRLYRRYISVRKMPPLQPKSS